MMSSNSWTACVWNHHYVIVKKSKSCLLLIRNHKIREEEGLNLSDHLVYPLVHTMLIPTAKLSAKWLFDVDFYRFSSQTKEKVYCVFKSRYNTFLVVYVSSSKGTGYNHEKVSDFVWTKIFFFQFYSKCPLFLQKFQSQWPK